MKSQITLKVDLSRNPTVHSMAQTLEEPRGMLAVQTQHECMADMATTRGVLAQAVVGACVTLWSEAVKNGEWANGNLHWQAVTGEFVDRLVGIAGFSKALESAGWIDFSNEEFATLVGLSQFVSDRDGVTRPRSRDAIRVTEPGSTAEGR